MIIEQPYETLSSGMKQYKDIKDKYDDCLLFYRLGDFYELFYDDAKIASRELGLVLTAKNSGNNQKAPMCGVPFHSYENYVAKLISNGHKVAICEQLSEPGKGIVERDVVRIITPGTVVDSTMLDETVNTYVMCIYKTKGTISYAYADISTGEFNVGSCSGDKNINYINDQIVRVNPSEIICNNEMFLESNNLPIVASDRCKKFNQYYEWAFNYNSAEKAILDAYNLTSTKGYDFDSENCISVIGALWQYLKETQKRELKHMSMPKYIYDEKYMYLDTNTRRNLEIDKTMREGKKNGSLLWVLDKTQTGGGARTLRKLVNQPIQSATEINKRLDCVEAIKNNKLLIASLKQEYENIKDIERIVGKLSYGSITPKECLSLMETLESTPKIKDILLDSKNSHLNNLAVKIEDLDDLRIKIKNTISDKSPATMKDGGYIKEGYSEELDYLITLSTNSKGYINQLEQKEKEETGIKNLKISYNKVFGYYIEVNKQYTSMVPFRYIRKQTVSNNERYITEELKLLEEELLSAEEKRIKLEAQIYENFKDDIFKYCSKLQSLANIISLIDAYMSLAIVAEENNYVRPIINTNDNISIKNGRHPVIEKLQRNNTFIANDTILNNKDDRTMILTGPNMAGKSTYMRQVALITIMAHIGSFVPADYAEICIVDRIFTRIGASDDLAIGQSTFMVEMVEVSNILRFATNKSLIILDEVGRGTSTHDGLSIAWSVVEYLSKHLTCKTLFATHYHELMQLEGLLEGVKNYCISIKEIAGELVFLRKIMRGSATRSYGIEVASLAGLPISIITRAKDILKDLEDGTIDTSIPAGVQQQPEMPRKYKETIDIIKSLNINDISPMVAFDTLVRLTDLIKGE